MINNVKSKDIFELNDIEYVLNYLKRRKIENSEYEEFIKNHGYGFFDDNNICINDEEYVLDCFLGKSENYSYDIDKCNQICELDQTKYCMVALLCGGDGICIKRNSKKIFFWSHEDFDSHPIVIAKNFDQFLKMIN